MKSVWGSICDGALSVYRWIGQKILGPCGALVVLALAIALVVLGFKGFQVGGLLGKLLGKEPEKGTKAISAANEIPEDRIDKDGKLIPVGTPDSKGITQAVVVPIEEPGIFGNPHQVKVTPPDSIKSITVDLPDGVKAKDVQKVIILDPETVVVSVKNGSKVTTEDVEDLLRKYKR